MEALEPGVSGPKVTAMQRSLNLVLPSIGLAKLKESGEYDDATTKAVGAFQEAADIGYSSGKWDAKTDAALKDALTHKKTTVVIDGQKYQVTKQELEKIKPLAFQQAAKTMDYYVNLADQAKSLWDAHSEVRQKNWFWGRAIEGVTGAKFPPQSVIDKAVSAAAAMKKDAASGKLDPKTLDSRSAPIRQAFADMDQYRDELFAGSDKMVDYLQDTADTCVVVLEVSAAIATAGASWQIQVGVAAGMGGYKELLTQVTKASTDPKVTMESAVESMFKAALIDGATAFVMKGGKAGLENVAEEIAKEACEEAARSGSKVLLKQYVIKVVQKMSTQIAEEVVKSLGKVLADPNQKVTPKDFVDKATEVVLKSFGVAVLGPALDKVTDKYSTKIDPDIVKKLMSTKGPVEDKAVKEALKGGLGQVIDKSATKSAKKVLDGWDPKDDPKGFEDEVTKNIVNDPDVKAAAAKASSQKKK